MKKKMKVLIFIMLIALINFHVEGQSISLDSMHLFKGDISNFIWHQNSIQVNQSSSGISQISAQHTWQNEDTFHLSSILNFSPSLNNYLEISFGSDSTFNEKYSFKIGQTGTEDALDLFLNGNIEFHNPNRNFGQGGEINLHLSFINDSLYWFNESHDIIRKIPWHTKFEYFQIKCVYTSSNAEDFIFENLYWGPVLKDTIGPKLIEVYDNQLGELRFVFSEEILEHECQFTPHPDSVTISGTEIRVFNRHNKDSHLSLKGKVIDAHLNETTIDTTIQQSLLEPYDLLITEIMFDPTPVVAFNYEYIEIYNPSSHSIDLKKVLLTIGNKTEELPDTTLSPLAYFLIKPNNALINSGSEITLQTSLGELHSIHYHPSMHDNIMKSEGGWSIEMMDINNPCIQNKNWTSSASINGGTPGYPNSVSANLSMQEELKIINVIPANDSTILAYFNYPPVPIDTNSNHIWIKDVIISELDFDYNQLTIHTEQLDSQSTYIINFSDELHSCSSLQLQHISLPFQIPSIPENHSLIINEILFNPSIEGADYIEVFNPTEKYYDLNKLFFASENSMGEVSDIHSISPHPYLIKPKEIVAISEDTQWVKEQFFNHGLLLNSSLPNCNNDDDIIYVLNQAGEVVDRLEYWEDWHFHGLSNVENVALEKIHYASDNKPAAWTSSSTMNNYGTPGLKNSHSLNPIEQKNTIKLVSDVITPNNDGDNDLLNILFSFNDPNWTGMLKFYDINGMLFHTSNSILDFNNEEVYSWDLKLSDNSMLKAGIYILVFEAVNTQTGELMNDKITFYVNSERL